MDLPVPQMRWKLPAFLSPFCALALGACATINAHVPAAEEEALKTDGVIARYHALLNKPFAMQLAAQGYIIGIEKSPRARIGFSGDGSDDNRLKSPYRRAPAEEEGDLEQQRATFDNVFDDPKIMFVSHILRYDQRNLAAPAVSLAHASYSHTGFGKNPKPALENGYEAGWAALAELHDNILADVDSARAQGKPFSHLMVLSMGWNNDQLESLERYNSVLHHSRRAAEREGRSFNPLVIGLTWPSVWGGTSVLDLANRALHLGSYPVKAVDADEIGFGIVNHLVNQMLPRIENETGLQTVLLGHSMGARILTRAYYSGHLLQDPVSRTGAKPIVIGLQGAFSANRFLKGYRLIAPVRWGFTGEGGPYQDHAAPGGTMILTWSKDDTANPVARVLSGAAHVGGRPGKKRIASTAELASKFENATLGDPDANALVLNAETLKCETIRNSGKALYIDATTIIADHGDIQNPNVGHLVWALVDCFGHAE